jgi:protein involved in polysaccharide export with SLBB domain
MEERTMRWLLGLLLTAVCALDIGAVGATPPRDGYRIGPNDVIRVQVFGEDDLTVESTVSGEGKMNYPLLGVLQVGGQTIEGVQKDLTARLASGYLRQPKVSVTIVRHRNFYVGGEVKTPGGYPYQEGLTVQKAITMAGGYTEKSDKTDIKVTRLSGKGVDAVSAEAETLVMPDDLIAVAQLQKFYVNGEVKKPGEYPYEKGLTVHKAITMAGGFTDKASTKRVKVLRRINSDERTLEIALDAPVLPQDIIVVRQRFF